MDDRCFSLLESYCDKQYVSYGRENIQTIHRFCRSILAQRRCPEDGLSDLMIEHILTQLSLMDANNFYSHLGGGEREGRVISTLVRRRHYGFSHGIGRSGNLTDAQPKAAGSTILYHLSNALMLDFLRLSGAPSFQRALCVPMATGMTISLVLQAIAMRRVPEVSEMLKAPYSPASDCTNDNEMVLNINEAGSTFSCPVATEKGEKKCLRSSRTPGCCRFVIWPRIDQKTALKCIDSAGFETFPVPLRPAPFLRGNRMSSLRQQRTCPSSAHPYHAEGSCPHHDPTALPLNTTSCSSSHPFFLQVHVDDIASAVELVGGPAAVLCILSTTSCFAPRLPDDVVAISRFAQEKNIPYVINNAYGTQSRTIMKQIERAQSEYRVDYVIQSGDKNFLVPVGGAVIASTNPELVDMVGRLYAGRASASPIIDLFITALHLGRNGMKQLWKERQEVWEYMVLRMRDFAGKRREILVEEWWDDDTEFCYQKEGTHNSPTRIRTFCARNDISLAVTMQYFGLHEEVFSSPHVSAGKTEGAVPTFSLSPKEKELQNAACRGLGAKLFRSRVTGPRVIIPAPDVVTTIAGKYTFKSYGCHQDNPLFPFLVMACGLGMTRREVDGVVDILEKLWPVMPSKEK